MVTQVYWIDERWRGRLGILPRPRGGDWLEDEIGGWRDSGFDIVVSLLTPDEVTEFGLEAERELCTTHRIEFIELPIPDRGVPTSTQDALALAQKLESSLTDGKKVGLHCRQGIGRSALIAACILVASGAEPHDAFERISTARGCPVPDTVEQKQWVSDFAPSLALQMAR